MKIYKTQAEVEADIKDGVLRVDGDVNFECSISIDAHLSIAGNINAGNINAWNINAGNINAGNINAGNINAGNINAGEISYYAFCCAYQNIKCTSIKARRDRFHPPICLDGKLEIVKKGKHEEPKDEIVLNGMKYRKVD